MNPFARAYWIAKGVGWDNVPRRLYQAFTERSGGLRRRLAPEKFQHNRFPLAGIDPEKRRECWYTRVGRFFNLPSHEQLEPFTNSSLWCEQVVAANNRAISGFYPMFSRWDSQLGWPPNFQLDSTNQIEWPVGPHWTQTTRSGPPFNDLKLVWEPSRMSLVYSLARAYRFDRNEKWAEAFWNLVESWIEQNPVQCSVAWGCGQEVAFRWMAILFGAVCCLESEATTPDRLEKVDLLAWQTAERIDANINYAISQENNHALSETVGLLTVGLMYPELPKSKKWLERGVRILEKELLRQIYTDGSYVQHSMSYHRVMLDDVLWSQGLLNLNGRSLSEAVTTRIQVAIAWLNEFVDSENGRVPNLGSNDGANVLPLSCSDYLDYRPVLTAAARMFQVPIQDFGIGPWEEKSIWLGPLNQSPKLEGGTETEVIHWQAPIGGYAILRGDRSYAMVRAGVYRDRPCQCDMLHVDLWVDHRNIVRDTGSFRYYHEHSSVKGYFYSVEAHNTVQVAGQEQMLKGPNFLWFHWPRATATIRSSAELECLAEFNTARPYFHHRRILREEDNYEIIDRISIKGINHREQEADLTKITRWHLCSDLDWTVSESERGVVRGAEKGELVCSIILQSDDVLTLELMSGWESLYYGERQKTPVLCIRWSGNELKSRFVRESFSLQERS